MFLFWFLFGVVLFFSSFERTFAATIDFFFNFFVIFKRGGVYLYIGLFYLNSFAFFVGIIHLLNSLKHRMDPKFIFPPALTCSHTPNRANSNSNAFEHETVHLLKRRVKLAGLCWFHKAFAFSSMENINRGFI